MINVRGISLIAALAIASLSVGQMDPQRDFVLSGKNAYMLLPQDFVCGPTIQEVAWSADGEKLAAIRMYADLTPAMMSEVLTGKPDERHMPDFEQQIITWSAVTRKTTTLMRMKANRGQIRSVQWISGSSSLVVEAVFTEGPESTRNPSSVFVLSSSGKTINIGQFDDSKPFEVNPSPYKPVVALIEHPPYISTRDGAPAPMDPPTMRFFGTEGALSEAIKMPGQTCIPFWSSNLQMYVLHIERVPKKPSKRTWYVVDRRAMKVTPSPAPPDEISAIGKGNAPDLVVQDMSATLSLKKTGVNAPSVVISAPDAKENELSVLTTDGNRGELSPKNNAVSYLNQGSLVVRSIVKVPLEAYLKAKESALKTRLLNQAKQVALAFIMNARDMDDKLPLQGSNLDQLLGPYLKDPSLLSGFKYTFAGGEMTKIEEPASTILGYIDGPGGRAVAYTDGHCKWINNP